VTYRRFKDALLVAFCLAVIGATTVTLVSIAPAPESHDFKRSAPAWPPNALARAVG
jgi:hypothetical protein